MDAAFTPLTNSTENAMDYSFEAKIDKIRVLVNYWLSTLVLTVGYGMLLIAFVREGNLEYKSDPLAYSCGIGLITFLFLAICAIWMFFVFRQIIIFCDIVRVESTWLRLFRGERECLSMDLSKAQVTILRDRVLLDWFDTEPRSLVIFDNMFKKSIFCDLKAAIEMAHNGNTPDHK